MNAPLPCVVTRDLGAYMRQQDAAEALSRAREQAAECTDPVAALERLREENYDAYLALQDALIQKDTTRAGELLSAAFEVEMNLFMEAGLRITAAGIYALSKARGEA